MPATAPFVVVDADQQSPSSRPDVTDSESDSDDELCVLTPKNPARAAVAVPVVTPVVQRPPAEVSTTCRQAHDVWQRRTLFNSNPTAKLPGALP